MRGRPARTAGTTLEVWSTTATVVVTTATRLGAAERMLREELAAVDQACSRFRADSEISRVLARPGIPVALSPLLNCAIGHALRVARATDHLVDPTVAAAVVALGYDRDIAEVVADVVATTGSGVFVPTTGADVDSVPAPGAWRVRHDPARRLLTVPAGVGLDLGATAKPLAADLAARRIARALDCGALVGIGGDLSVAGEPPDEGWQVDVGDDHRAGAPAWQTVSLRSGGLATSSTTVRRWRTASGGWRHHIVDPRTGDNPAPVWRTAAVAAGSSVDANAAATAAIILGARARRWLAAAGLPALLIGEDGRQVRVGGWPAEHARRPGKGAA